MKIVIAAWRDLANPLAGGSEVLVDHLCAGLTSRGHDVTLLCAEPVGTGHPYRVEANGGTITQYLRAPFAYWRHHRDADLVVDISNGVSFYVPVWRRGASMALVNHIHTEQWPQWFPRPVAAVGSFMELRAMPAAYRNQLIVAVSPSTADLLEGMGIDRRRIRIIINGTELPEAAGTEGDEPLFVGIGRLVPHKRFHLAVEAFNQIQPTVGGRLVIAGEGPELERLRRMAGPGVELPGRISDEDKDELLRRAWLMVHPASHEGWGLVITEAAAYGVPSLAFRVPGLQDSIVDGMSGVLVDRPEELAEAWAHLAVDAEQRARLRAGALRRAAACSWDATVDRFEEICLEAVQSHRRSLQLPSTSWQGPDDRITVDEFHGGTEADEDAQPLLAGIPASTGRRGLQVVRDRPDLTLILPAFNEARRLPVSIPILADHLRQRDDRIEVIVVDDGSSDDTVEVAGRLLEEIPRAGVLQLGRHAGKGAAVRAGVARASGERILFMDADLATDLSNIDAVLAALDRSHLAVGSRSAPGAVTSGVTPSSDAAHRSFNALARRATGMDITDFQCGFKGFRAAEGRVLFQLLRERGYVFDVELLTLASRMGLDIEEVPVAWKAVRGSHVRIVHDSVQMAYQVIRVGRRRTTGQVLSAVEAFPDDRTRDLDEVRAAVADALAVPAPTFLWEKGVLALLPFVEPVDAAELAHALESSLEGILVRPTAISARGLLDPGDRRLARAFAGR